MGPAAKRPIGTRDESGRTQLSQFKKKSRAGHCCKCFNIALIFGWTAGKVVFGHEVRRLRFQDARIPAS